MESQIEVKNPATGQTIQKISTTSVEKLPAIFQKAREVQKDWAQIPLKKRCKKLTDLRECIVTHCDDLIDLISNENGKPKIEAMVHDLIPSLDALTNFSKSARKVLSDRSIPLINPVLKTKVSKLDFWPLGIVTVISPWNYPFFLPFTEVIMALVAGNAVILKPSEVTPLCGLKIQELCEEAGFPRGLVQTVIGDGKIGAAIIDQKPAKIFFTGSVNTGKRIAKQASECLIPVNLELGGKDPMIILSDADLDFASSIALWGTFANSGQICASTERILVQESIADEFKKRIKEKVSQLKFNPTNMKDTDLGAITFKNQKTVLEKQIKDAKNKNASFLTGGKFRKNKISLEPTLIEDNGADLEAYIEESFGPIAVIKTFHSIDEAVELANRSKYALSASVVTSNLSLGEDIAKRLETGTVLINEVAYAPGLTETPWGGLKDSGYGKRHSDIGLLEFVNIRHINKPISRALIFKSFWWFPYSPYQYITFRKMIAIYHKSWFDKLKALPLFLWNFVQFFKKEKRL